MLAAYISIEDLSQQLRCSNKDSTDKVSAADKTAVEKAIGGLKNYKPWQYLDVNLFKVSNGVQNPITETKTAITITFEVPAALRGNSSDSRTYSVIRVHGGKTTVLNDLDSDPNTVTIKTDKFSTYSLTYREDSSSTPSGSGSGSRPRPTTPTTPTDNNNSNSNSSDTTSNGSTSGDNISSGGNSGGNTPSGSNSGDSTSSSNSTSDERTHNPSDSSPSEGTANPATGIAISFVPLAAVFAALPLTIRRRR